MSTNFIKNYQQTFAQARESKKESQQEVIILLKCQGIQLQNSEKSEESHVVDSMILHQARETNELAPQMEAHYQEVLTLLQCQGIKCRIDATSVEDVDPQLLNIEDPDPPSFKPDEDPHV